MGLRHLSRTLGRLGHGHSLPGPWPRQARPFYLRAPAPARRASGFFRVSAFAFALGAFFFALFAFALVFAFFLFLRLLGFALLLLGQREGRGDFLAGAAGAGLEAFQFFVEEGADRVVVRVPHDVVELVRILVDVVELFLTVGPLDV